MNEVELSNHKINNLNEQSRRNNILINEVVNDVNILEADLNETKQQNRNYLNKIDEMQKINLNTNQFVNETKRKLNA